MAKRRENGKREHRKFAREHRRVAKISIDRKVAERKQGKGKVAKGTMVIRVARGNIIRLKNKKEQNEVARGIDMLQSYRIVENAHKITLSTTIKASDYFFFIILDFFLYTPD